MKIKRKKLFLKRMRPKGATISIIKQSTTVIDIYTVI
jgi:hypothetical protein